MLEANSLVISDEQRIALIDALARSFPDGPAIGRALQDSQERLADIMDVQRGAKDVASDAVQQAIGQEQVPRLLRLALAAAPLSEPLRKVARQVDPALLSGSGPHPYGLPAQLPMLLRTDPVFGREELLEDLAKVVTEAASGTWFALHGLPGVGKTRLAALLSDHLVAARNGGKRFDCVVETSVGRGEGTRPRERSLERCAERLGILGATTQGVPAEDRVPSLCRAIREELDRRLDGWRVLVVVDDVWDADDAKAHDLGGDSVYLVTTHDQVIANQVAIDPSRTLGLEQCMRLVPELGPEASAAMLRHYAPAAAGNYPDRVAKLAESVGYLPFQLMLIYRQLQGAGSMRNSPKLIGRTLDEIERELDTARRQGLHDLDATLEACLSLVGGNGRAALARMSLFPPKPSSFSDEAAVAIAADAANGFDKLATRGLVDSVPRDRFALHQIVADFASRLLEGSPDKEDAVRAFVEFYAGLARERADDEAALRIEMPNIGAAAERAIERLDQPEFAAWLVDGANACSSFLLARGMYETARRYLEHARRASTAMDRDHVEKVAVNLASHLEKLGEFPSVVALLEPFAGLGSDLADATAATARAFYVRSVIAYNLVRYEEAEALIDRGMSVLNALDAARQDGTPAKHELRARCDLLERLCLIHSLRGLRGDAAAWQRALCCGVEGRAIANRLRDEPRRLVHLCNLAWVYRALRDPERWPQRTKILRRLARLGLDHATRVYHAEYRTAFHHLLGVLARDAGDQGEAEQEFRAALRVAEDIGHRWYQALVHIDIGWIEMGRKRPKEALEAFDKAADLARRIGAADLEDDAGQGQAAARSVPAVGR